MGNGNSSCRDLIPSWQCEGTCVDGWTLLSDAAVRESKIGLGGWFSDKDGVCQAAFATCIEGSYSPLLAEALALRHGLRFAMDSGFKVKAVLTDSLEVVGAIANSEDLDPFFEVLTDIKNLLTALDCSSCCYVPRKDNVVAHNIASWASYVPRRRKLWMQLSKQVNTHCR